MRQGTNFHPQIARVIHDSCAPSNHVTTKHSGKQHHAVTSLFVGRWLPAEQPEILMQRLAFVSLLL